jgi:hypothetical protein
MKNGNSADLEQLPAFADVKNDVLNAIVETPKRDPREAIQSPGAVRPKAGA